MGTYSKLVSVGIPTYNRKDGLLRAIKSVISQSYKNLEIIIGDNSSPDYDDKFINNLINLDSRIRYFRHNTNLGPVGNFDFVRKKGKGDYFLWLADDDWIDQDYINRCVEFLESERDYVLVNSSINYYVESKILYSVPPVRLNDECPRSRVVNYYKTVAENGVYYGLMRKCISDRVPLKNVIGSDWLFVAGLAYLGKIGGIDDIFLHRNHTWNSESINRIADQAGLRDFERKFPYVSIALHARNDILTDPVYSDLNYYYKIVFSWIIFWTVCNRKKIGLWSIMKALFCYKM